MYPARGLNFPRKKTNQTEAGTGDANVFAQEKKKRERLNLIQKGNMNKVNKLIQSNNRFNLAIGREFPSFEKKKVGPRTRKKKAGDLMAHSNGSVQRKVSKY